MTLGILASTPTVTASCQINLIGSCTGNCEVNVGIFGDCLSGTCTVNFEECAGGNCAINMSTCWSGTCTVNAPHIVLLTADCNGGNCTINYGYCGTGCSTLINLSSCGSR